MAFLIEPGAPRTRTARLRIPTNGVRAEINDDDWWTDLQAIALVLPEHAIFSHTTAARIAGIPLPEVDPRPFHVTVPHHRGRRNGIVWHQRPMPDEPEYVRGFRVTGPLQTWLDLGSVLDVDDLVAAADLLLRRGLVAPDTLKAVPPVRGANLLRSAAALASPRSWSPRESLLRMAMHRHGLPEPALNVEIIEDGIVLGTGDLVFDEFRCIVDYDGDTHREWQQRIQDTQTRNAYGQAGWIHLGVTSHMFDRMPRTLISIESMLRRRGWSDPCTPRELPSRKDGRVTRAIPPRTRAS